MREKEFLAIARRPGGKRAVAQRSESVADHREQLLQSSEMPACDELLALGFTASAPPPGPHGNGPVAPPERGKSRVQPLPRLDAMIVHAKSSREATRAANTLSSEGDYAIVPNLKLSLPASAGGKSYSSLPKARRAWPEVSGVSAAHEAGVTGEGVLIGVLDTGCDCDHLEFRKRHVDFRWVPLQRSSLRSVRGFDVGGHGTHVCGILAGQRRGVAPGADLMVAGVIESERVSTSLERIFLGLDWMLSEFELEENLERAAIVSMSLGFLPRHITGTSAEAAYEGVELLLDKLVDFEVLPVVAIGNEGPGVGRLPALLGDVLSVGAVDDSLEPWERSGGGSSPYHDRNEPDIAGFGVDVLSSWGRTSRNRSIYREASGTSMATPYVAGIAALHAASEPGLLGQELKRRVLETALPLPDVDDRVGAGLARFPS